MAGTRGVDRRVELNFKQIPGIEQDSCIQHHAAFAHFRAPALYDRGREALRRDDPYGQVYGQAIPSARFF